MRSRVVAFTQFWFRGTSGYVDPMTTQTSPTFGNTNFGEAGGY